MIGGSQQLRRFRIAMRDGLSIEDAADRADISLGEARLHAVADLKNPPPPEAYILLGHHQGEARVAITGEVVKPDLKKMKKLFTTDLAPASEKAAKIRGDQSAAWKTIEADYHCNKRAAKFLLKLQGESEETRHDVLATLIPGLIELDLIPREDLADMMGADVDLDKGVKRGSKGLGTEGMPGLQ